ncbi:MAG TPA: ArsR family transcriptional regulator [Candidatus Cloacimonetes bacterium]|nr:ArsR family transcriptional regulator [Candidatus Cloacimonadota bacterium]HEX38193.1 ArsR family transcriptional regulator [Candidatus Cloacimonadota bacterium]
MTDNKITLDRKILRALSSDTRINILKSLNIRPMTVSELSRILNLPKSTIHENLEKLIDAGLVKKNKSEGRKRVYYELTEKGRRLLLSHKTRIILLLSSAASFICGIIAIYFSIKIPEEAVRAVRRVPLEQNYLIFGVILLSLGFLFLYLASRSHINEII